MGIFQQPAKVARPADAARNRAGLIEGTIKSVKEGNVLTQATQEAYQEQAQGIDQVNKAVAEMDKVVQQVAANAEESASAAEEMNAQAMQMKGFVGELVSLVGGAGGSWRGTADRSGDHPVRAIPPRVHRAALKGKGANKGRELATHPAALSVHPGKEVGPQEVIPLDEKDFRDI